jgi:CRP-like cAMP-binding protein
MLYFTNIMSFRFINSRDSLHASLKSAENFCNDQSPDMEIIGLSELIPLFTIVVSGVHSNKGDVFHSAVQSILSNKPLSCDDIQSAEDARRELKRIRELVHDFEQSNYIRDSSLCDPEIVRKTGRNAIHAEENFDDYVKRDVPKETHIRRLIYDAIKTNVMFKFLMMEELEEIIDVFEPCVFNAGDAVIRQGDRGDDFYVVEDGIMWMSISINGQDTPLCSMPYEFPSFGEHALIYGSLRAATISATMDGCKLWRIRRGWYRGVVGQHRQRLHMEKLSFLPKVKIGNKLFGEIFDKDQLHTMAQLLKWESYAKGETILRQGESGDSLYIIQSGEVSVYVREMEGPIGPMQGKGYIFGENALLADDVRQATVVAAR